MKLLSPLLMWICLTFSSLTLLYTAFPNCPDWVSAFIGGIAMMIVINAYKS